MANHWGPCGLQGQALVCGPLLFSHLLEIRNLCSSFSPGPPALGGQSGLGPREARLAHTLLLTFPIPPPARGCPSPSEACQVQWRWVLLSTEEASGGADSSLLSLCSNGLRQDVSPQSSRETLLLGAGQQRF